MSRYVTIHGINVKILDIAFDPQLNRPTKAILGASGSQTSYLGSGGRLLNLSILCNGNEYHNFENLYKLGKKMPLISKSAAKYNGMYHITIFTADEYKPNRFKITMKLQEDFKFNITQMNFVSYATKPKTTGTEIKVGEKWNVGAS